MTLTITTHELLVSKLLEKDLLRSYAYFLKFKYLFGSSRLNKANRAKLSRMTGVSDKTVRVQVSKMIKMGWARMDGKDLVFVPLKELYQLLRLPYKRFNHIRKVAITIKDNVKTIVTKLASILVEANLDRQRYVLAVKQKNHYSSNTDGHRLADKDRHLLSKHGLLSLRPSEMVNATLSCRGFGALVGKSRTVGHQLKQMMKELGLITVTPNVRMVRDVRHNFKLYQMIAERCPQQNLYYRHGKVWERHADTIIFVSA